MCSHSLLWGSTGWTFLGDECSSPSSVTSVFFSLLLGLHRCIPWLPFYFGFIHSPRFLPVVSGGWDLMRLLWLVQQPNWVFSLLFRCGLCFSGTTASQQHIRIPGPTLPLRKNEPRSRPFPAFLTGRLHIIVTTPPHPQTPLTLSQWSCRHSHKGGGQISWTASLWTIIFIKVIVVAGPCYSR